MRPRSALLFSSLLFCGCVEDSPDAGGEASSGEASGTDSASSGDEEESSSSSATDGGPDFAMLEAELDALRSEAGAPGMAVGLILGDQVVWTGGFGTRDVASGAPVTRDTPFRLGSISKTFVGVAMLRAQELGVIALEDSIAMPFPVENPHLQTSEVTYLDLAHHMSGIVDSERYNCAYVAEGGAAYLSPDEQTFCPDAPVAELETFLAEYLTPEGSMYGEDNFADDTTYAYSNVGAALAAASLGRATEAALGLDFIAFCDAEVFGPLSMDHTRWTRDALPDPEAAAVPHVLEDGFVPMARYDLATYPDGGLYSSVDDLSRYLAAIVPGRGAGVLQSESVDGLLTFVDPGGDDFVEGQGVFWERYLGLVGHTGGDPGVATAIGYDLETGVGLVLLLNSTGPNTETLMLQVFDALLSFAEML